MVSGVQSLGLCLVVLTLWLFAGSAGAQDVSPRCEAAMDRAAGHYSRCLLRADAHYSRHENASKLENRQARCETRFDRRTARAINRHGADACPSSDLVAAIGDRTVTYAEGVATEAHGVPAASVLFVQNGTGGTLSETTLTLTGVSSQTGWFTDRPYRDAGQIPTEEFLSQWDEGESSFADDPPNADFTCEVEGEVVNYAVELTSPHLEGGDLSYAVTAVGHTVLPEAIITCESDTHLFGLSSITGTGSEYQSLDMIVTVTRHGVRAPAPMNTAPPHDAAPYASRAWPLWPVPNLDLTPHGQELASKLGRYYRLFYAPQLGFDSTESETCPPEDWLVAVPDNVERDVKTAEGFSSGMFPSCEIDLKLWTGSGQNPIFHPTKSIATYSGDAAKAAVLARIGSLQSLQADLSNPLAVTQSVLDCCQPQACDNGTCTLETLPSGFRPSGLVYGTLNVGPNAVETWLMEYAQGMPTIDVGWGDVDLSTILELLPIYNTMMSVLQSTDGPAQAQGSNIVAHVLASMQQRVTGVAVDALAQPTAARMVSYFGHDYTIANVAGVLGLTWNDPQILENGTPPAGAIVFELHEDLGEYSVRPLFVAQTLDQMRDSTDLDLDNPPLRIPVTMARCGAKSNVQTCSFDDFVSLAVDSINKKYVAAGLVPGP